MAENHESEESLSAGEILRALTELRDWLDQRQIERDIARRLFRPLAGQAVLNWLVAEHQQRSEQPPLPSQKSYGN